MYTQVKVTPGEPREKVEKVGEKRFRVCVKEKVERNLAKARVKKLLGELYGCESKVLRIVNGGQRGSKLFLLNEGRKK